jgi:hypothetical protein
MNPAAAFLPVVVSDDKPWRDRFYAFQNERIGNPAHILARIFLRQKLFDLGRHILSPDLQCLPLVVNKRFQHVPGIASFGPDFICAGRKPLDNGVL